MQKMIFKRLESECFGPRSIEIYGGAYHLYNNGEPTIEDIVRCMFNAVDNAKFFTPDTRPITTARRFCGLIMIDPMLIEVYLGVRLGVLFA